MLDKANLYYGKINDFTYEILNNKMKRKYFAVNTDCYNIASKDKTYRDILLDPSHKIYVDGVGILMGQKITESKISKERIATTDLFTSLLEDAENHTFFLLGGTPGTAEKVIDNLAEKYTNAKFVGSHHGYFSKDNSQVVIDQINILKPDILLIGFGCPIQEKWVVDNFDYINAINFITCGGLFDYYSDNVRRAPKWVQKLGFEWLFRLFQEPSRLFKRYIYGNSKFLLTMLMKRLNNKKI